jgi:lipid-binding SYLF domain-containing protein
MIDVDARPALRRGVPGAASRERPRRAICWLFLALLVLPPLASADRIDRKREQIDLTARQNIERLLEEDDGARGLFEQAYGYAVFDVVKVSLFVTGGGGQGVAVNKSSGARTYMNMGTGGLNLGLGGKAYAIVFLFQTQQHFDDFVNNGWQGGVSADATAGRASADIGANFHNGIAYYQLTDAGLMLQADITGTKYWKSGKLNR